MSPEREREMWNALVDYCIKCDEPVALLTLWREGCFDEIRRDWPDVPSTIFPDEGDEEVQAEGSEEAEDA